MIAPGEPAATAPDVAPSTPPATAELQSAALHGSWWTAVQSTIGLPLAFAVNLVVARELGPHGFGVVASYAAAYTLGLIVLNGGVSDAFIQWAAAAFARGQRAQLIELVRRCAGFHIFVEAPLAAVAAAVLLHRESATLQIVGAVSVAITLGLGTTAIALTSMSGNAGLAKQSLIIGVAVNLAVVTAAVQSHAAGPVWVARIAVSVLASAVPLLIAPRDVRRASFTPLLPRGWPDGFARFSVRTLAAALVSTLVFSRSEVLLLDGSGRAVGAGLFALAAGIATQITAPIDAILGPLIPAAAGLVAVGRHRAAAAVLRGIRLSALATAPVVLVVVPAVATVTPAVYGSSYGTTGRLFVLLGVISCLQSVLHPVWAFAGALRLPLTLLVVNAVAFAVDLVVVLVLLPSLGVYAAAIGNTAGQLISLTGSLWLLRRHLGLAARDAARVLTPFAAAGLCAAAGAVAGLVVVARTGSVWWAPPLAVAASVVAGTSAIRLCGGLVSDADAATLVETFPWMRRAVGVLSRAGWVRPRAER